MANPVLNEKALEAATVWSQPQRGAQGTPTYDAPGPNQWGQTQTQSGSSGPISNGPFGSASGYNTGDTMTVSGTATATGVLLVLLFISAAFGWMATGEPELVQTIDGPQYNYSIPITAWVGVGIGFVCVIGLMFRPQFAKFVAPIYALAEGFFVGAISRMYETYYDGIVIQAVGVTLAVFAVMLFMYRFEIIKVTDKFRKTVMFATLGIMVFYGVSFLIRLFAGSDSVSFLSSPSLLGIGFSVVVAGIAALNLALDFDFIARGQKMGLHKDFEWYGAFALLVTIVWLYLEILRLLSKLRER